MPVHKLGNWLIKETTWHKWLFIHLRVTSGQFIHHIDFTNGRNVNKANNVKVKVIVCQQPSLYWEYAWSLVNVVNFVFAGPATCNSLPSSVQELSNTECFKRHLETSFQRCLGCNVSFYFVQYFVTFVKKRACQLAKCQQWSVVF